MQFTEQTPIPPLYDLCQTGPPQGLRLDLNSGNMPQLSHTLVGGVGGAVSVSAKRPWAGFPASCPNSTTNTNKPSVLTGATLSTTSCMEQLLLHCATAVETNDATLAQQILWVLNNIAPPDGDSNQRLAASFLRALVSRATNTGCCKMLTSTAAADIAVQNHVFSPVALASFLDLTPWYRFGYTAANAAIVEAVEGFSVVHVVDLSTTHCMQIPTLIDALANRPEGPPFLRLTVPVPALPEKTADVIVSPHEATLRSASLTSVSPPPLLDMSYDELGARLVNFARSRNVAMEFKAVPSTGPGDAFEALLEEVRARRVDGEALVVNCQMLAHCVPDETAGAISIHGGAGGLISLRTVFLKALRELEPLLVTLVDEDIDLVSTDLLGRLRSAFNYLWIPFDAVDTFLPKGSERRRWYEAEISWKIENVVAYEDIRRVERQETRGRWAQRMRAAGFRGAPFGEETATEVKAMLDDHAAGWGLKREEDDLVLTWKGHNVVFATAWLPC